MTARLAALLVTGWAASCGGRATSRDGGPGPRDAGAEAYVDAAPSDAGNVTDAGLDGSTDAARCLVEACECGERSSTELDRISCPPEARFCCSDPMDTTPSTPPQCSPRDDVAPNYDCTENPLDSGEPSDCRVDDDDGDPWTYADHSERCPDERPYCCGEPDTIVLCADHDLTGWFCSIGILADCAHPWDTPDSTLCPDDYPWCCVSEETANAVCSAHYPPPEGWRCDLD